MNGLSFLHLELTSRCNKSCWMCGRRKTEKQGVVDWGDMDFDLLRSIALQVPKEIVIQFHNNGEPLVYPHLGWALNIFPHNIRCLDTNGKLLLEKSDEIIGILDTLTISVIEDDPEREEQIEQVTEFLRIKGSKKPNMVYRLLGKVDESPWSELPGVVARRILHDPGGSYDYQKKPTIPEIGICLDLLTHLAIDRLGNVSLCVRFDPEGKLRLGNVNGISLSECWRSEKRRKYIQYHIEGRRSELPGCQSCEYWGCPRG